MSNPQVKNKKFTISLMIILAIWLMALLGFASWFQSQYIQSFTSHNPQFLDAQYTESWARQLISLLPPKKTNTRVVQFWMPDCLCNRFAHRHSSKVLDAANKLNVQHITLIPLSAQAQISELQALNPLTEIMVINPDHLNNWPSAPSLLIEGPSQKLAYFGPLGFGAFCSQSSTNIIEIQLNNAITSTAKPFFNVLGKGCFCPWK